LSFPLDAMVSDSETGTTRHRGWEHCSFCNWNGITRKTRSLRISPCCSGNFSDNGVVRVVRESLFRRYSFIISKNQVQIVAFWNVTSFCIVDGYQRLAGSCVPYIFRIKIISTLKMWTLISTYRSTGCHKPADIHRPENQRTHNKAKVNQSFSKAEILSN
jgi:hypothetical protein